MRHSAHTRGPSAAGAAPAQSRLTPVAALVLLALIGAALSACASVSRMADDVRPGSAFDPKTGTSASQRVVRPGEPVPKGGGTYKLGSPYKVSGRWYVPREEPGYDRVGIASWYGEDFHGRRTANGEIYDMDALSAAHPTLPLPSFAYVTNLANGRTVLVRINDRGPYVGDRIIDLSRRTAHELGLKGAGTGRVRVQYAGPAPLDGDDRHERRFLASQSWRGGEPPRAYAANPEPQPSSAGGADNSWSVTGWRQGLRSGSRQASASTAALPARPAGGDWGRTYVQVGLFRGRGQVEQLRRELAGFGPVEVDAMTQGTDPIYRVRVGPFSEPTAGDVLSRVRYAGLPGDGIVQD